MSKKSGPRIFKLGDKTYRVKKKKWGQTKFKYDYAYTLSDINDFVYPYRGEIDNIDYAYIPGIYLMNGKSIVIRPKTEEEMKYYSKKRIIELTPDSIFRDLSDDIDIIKEPVITDGDVFKPEIRDTDDIILAGVKYCISNKNHGHGINFNAYGNRFSDVATKNNARRAITHGDSLKMAMATRYSDVFDINIMAGFWDKEGCVNPMSDKKTLYVIFNDQEIDIKDPDLDVVVITKDQK